MRPTSGHFYASDATAPSYFAGNVGIGSTSPGRLLDVNGPMRIEPAALPGTPAAGDLAIDSGSSNTLKYYNGSAWVSASGGGGSGTNTFNTGTAAAPPINFLGDTTTGFFDAGSHTIGVSANGSQAMTLSSTGIAGTGAMTVAAGGTAQSLSLNASTSGAVNLGNGDGTQVQIADGGASTVDYLTFKGAPTNGGTQANTSPVIGTAGTDTNINLTFTPKGAGNTIFSSGNVGIGTSSPSGTFDVEGGTAAAATNGANIALNAQNAGSGSQNGGNISLTAGSPTGAGGGGNVNITIDFGGGSAVTLAAGTTTALFTPSPGAYHRWISPLATIGDR